MALKVLKDGRGRKHPVETETEEGIIDFVEGEYDRRQKEKQPFELQWRLNISFIEGKQHVEINPAQGKVDEVPKAYWWQERESFNHVAPMLEVRRSRLSRMRPKLKARPATNDQEDIRSAKVGTSILRNIYYNQGVQHLMKEIYAWAESTGTVVMKNTWNPDLGPTIRIEQNFQRQEEIDPEKMGVEELIRKIEEGETARQDEQVEPDSEDTTARDTEDNVIEANIEQQQAIEIKEGDLEPIVCSPFEIFPDSCYNQNIENCRSIIHAKSFHVDEIKETWGVEVTPEQSEVMKLQPAAYGEGGLSYGRGDFQMQNSSLEDHAVVKEYWERPSKEYPEGRLIITAGKKLLHYGALPYPVGPSDTRGLPFVKANCIERPGIFWGKAVVERAIPVQRRYNAIKNRKAEFLNRAAIGSWFVERGSIDMDEFEEGIGSPGYIAEIKKNSQWPQPAQPGHLPQEFKEEEEALLNEFNTLIGVSDISKQSTAPPGVKSGVAISLALEQDDIRLSIVAGNIENMLVECGRHWLRMYRHFVSSARMLREIGRNNVIELIDFTGSDIRSDDVVVEAFSAMAESPAQRRQMVFDLIGAGLLIDPETGQIDRETRSKIFDMIEMGNWESADSETELHISRADRENLAILEGGDPEVASYDDHIVHINNHNKFRLSADYERMMAQNPMLEQVFQKHVDQHLMQIADTMPPPGAEGGGEGGPKPAPGGQQGMEMGQEMETTGGESPGLMP